MPTRDIALEEHTVNNLVSSIVNTSVDDGKNAIKRVCEIIKLPTAGRLRILRGALADEKDGQARASLLTALRSAIRSLEKAIEGEELPPVHEGDSVEITEESAEDTADDVVLAEDGDADDDEEPYGAAVSGVADLSAFSIHPDLDRIAMMSATHAALARAKNKDAAKVEITEGIQDDWTAFVDEIYLHGVLEPIKVLKIPARLPDEVDGVQYLIVDGRHRWQASQEAGLATIPFEIVDHSQARAIMEGTITARRNYTKAQKAYIAVLFHPELLDVKAGNPQFGINAELGKSDSGAMAEVSVSPKNIATKYGVGERTMRQAVEVSRLMDSLRGTYPRKVEAQELEIWAGAGLPSVLSALKGISLTAGKKMPQHVNSGVASRYLKGFATVSKDFASWNQAQVMAFRDEVITFWDEVDDGFADFLTLCRVRDNATIESIIAARELAKEEGAV